MSSARTARAAVYDAPNTPFVIRRYPLRDVRPGEVLVRVTMSTICRSDIHSYHGLRPNPCPGIERTITSINPANGEVLGAVPLADECDVDRAVAAARAAFPAWAALPVTRRAECLRRLADAVDRNAGHLALMDAVDSGNAISGMRGDMDWTSAALRYFAGLVTEMKGETMSRERGHLNVTLRQPYGVVARINPFNHPFRFCAEKAAAALAAGNTVVIKGPEQASLVTNDFGAAMRAAERLEAGYVWINSSGRYLGAPYGGWKQSGIGKEESFEELLSFTRVKNINMRW